MKIKGFLPVVLIIGLIVIVVSAMVLGYFPVEFNFIENFTGDNSEMETPSDAEKITMSNRDIFQVIEWIAGKNLSYTDVEPYIESLHLEMWGINDATAYSTLTWYEEEYSSQGYTSISDSVLHYTGATVYNEGWNKNEMVKSVSVADGSMVTSLYDYDTVIITGWGPATTYYDFYIMLNT